MINICDHKKAEYIVEKQNVLEQSLLVHILAVLTNHNLVHFECIWVVFVKLVQW